MFNVDYMLLTAEYFYFNRKSTEQNLSFFSFFFSIESTNNVN